VVFKEFQKTPHYFCFEVITLVFWGAKVHFCNDVSILKLLTFSLTFSEPINTLSFHSENSSRGLFSLLIFLFKFPIPSTFFNCPTAFILPDIIICDRRELRSAAMKTKNKKKKKVTSFPFYFSSL